MPRRPARVKRGKPAKAKPRKSLAAKKRKPVYPKPRKTSRLVQVRPSTQSAEQIWKEKVSPMFAPDLDALDQNIAMLEEAMKQTQNLILWADRHSKRLEAYVLTAISSLNVQAAYEANVLKVLLLRLGSVMVDIDLLAEKPGGAGSMPPELEASIQKVRATIASLVEANKASTEAAKRVTLYF